MSKELASFLFENMHRVADGKPALSPHQTKVLIASEAKKRSSREVPMKFTGNVIAEMVPKEPEEKD